MLVRWYSEKIYDDPSRIAREHARYKIGRNKRARMELISDGTHWAVKSKLLLPVIVTRISTRLLDSLGSTRYPWRIEKFTKFRESV